MKEVIEKQTALLQTVEKYLSNDRVIQLSQATSQDQSEKKLDLIYHVLKDGMVDDGNKKALNSNVIKLFNEIKNQTKEIKGLSKLVPVSPEQSKAILDKSRQNREFKSIGQRITSAKENVKDLFTARGFLDKTGIVKRGSGGIVAEYLDAKEDVKKYAKARVEAGDSPTNDKQKNIEIFERQRTQQQELQRKQGDDERKIESYKKLGISEKQIDMSPEAKRLQKTAVELAKVNPAVRPKGFDVRTGMIKTPTTENKKAKEPEASKATAKKETAEKETPAKTETAKKETTALAPLMQLTNSAEKRNNDDAIDIDFKEVVRQPALAYEEPKATAKKETTALASLIQPTVAKVTADPLAAEETASESQRIIEKQTDLLSEIAENTSRIPKMVKAPSKKGEESADGGGFLSGILGFLGEGLMKAVKFLFNPKNILKFISKIALPAMIIGSLVSGIMDGFKAFAETGDIGEALIAGLGGVLSFLSFGLFDAETVRGVVDAVKGFVDDYIIEPVKNFFSFISDSFEKYIVKPLSDFFAPVIDFFKSVKDQLLSMVESIGIPEISFTIPLIDKKVSIGPFYPFKKESAKAQSGGAAPIAPGNSDAGAGRGSSEFTKTDPRRLDNASSSMSAPKPMEGTEVYNKSIENAEVAGKPVQTAPIIVSAPTTNNSTSKQNITMPTPIRNDDSGFNRYLSRNAAII